MSQANLIVVMGVSLLIAQACTKDSPRDTSKQTIASPVKLPMDLQREHIALPSGANALAPALFATENILRMVWLEPPEGSSKMMALRYSEYQDGVWGNTMTLYESDKIFANWADTPSVSVNRDGDVLVHWAEKSGPATYAYDVRIGLLQDKTFKDLGTVHRDKTQTEHGFVSIVPDGQDFQIAWLDGRKTAGGHHDSDDHHSGDQAMTLRYSRYTPQGLTPSIELDDRVCDCCNTSAVQLTSGFTVLYRDRSNDEIRDISIAQVVDDNRTLKPRPLSSDNWKINGCPVNGPRIAAQDPLVAAAWFTKANGTGHIKVRFSQDAAATWGETYQVDADDPVGRVDLLALPNGQFVVSWLGRTKDGATLNLRRVANDGTMTPVSRLAALPASRKTGVPRMARVDDNIFLVWTEPDTSETELQAMRISWQAVGTKLLTPAIQNSPSPDEENSPLTLTDLELVSPKGEPLEFKRAKRRVVAFWANWCRPCWQELPVLEQLRQRPNIELVLATTQPKHPEALVDELRAEGYNGEIGFFAKEEFPNKLNLGELPATWIFDESGSLLTQITGLISVDDVSLQPVPSHPPEK